MCAGSGKGLIKKLLKGMLFMQYLISYEGYVMIPIGVKLKGHMISTMLHYLISE